MESNPLNKEKSIEITFGQVVRLKSGGPKMTVKYQRQGDWICTWFSGDEMKEGAFDKGQLEIAE